MGRAIGERHLRVAGENGKNPYAGAGAGDYDPDSFYIRASDTHGHTNQRRVNLAPETAAQIDAMLATGKLTGTPVDSFSAFMRNAAVHELHRLARVLVNPDIAVAAERETRLAKADMTAAAIEKAKRVLSEARERFQTADRDGDVASAQEFIEIYTEIAPTLREPYRDRLMAEITAAERRLK